MDWFVDLFSWSLQFDLWEGMRRPIKFTREVEHIWTYANEHLELPVDSHVNQLHFVFKVSWNKQRHFKMCLIFWYRNSGFIHVACPYHGSFSGRFHPHVNLSSNCPVLTCAYTRLCFRNAQSACQRIPWCGGISAILYAMYIVMRFYKTALQISLCSL